MIYLAHSKAPSNESSSRRTQCSASSSIERKNLPTSRPNAAISFVGPSTIRLGERSTPLSPDGVSIVKHSISKREQLLFQTQKSLLTGGGCTTPLCLAFPPDRRAKAKTKSNHFQRNTLGAPSKTATPGTSHIYYHYYYYSKKKSKMPTSLLSSQPTILILMIVTLSTKILSSHWKIGRKHKRLHSACITRRTSDNTQQITSDGKKHNVPHTCVTRTRPHTL